MTVSDRQRTEPNGAIRLLYLDPQPDVCIRALDAARDISVFLETASDLAHLGEAFRVTRPHALIVAVREEAFRLIELAHCLDRIGAAVPVLLSGRREATGDVEFRAALERFGLDVRGTVRLCERIRDFQLLILTAAKCASRLRGN
jgi:hypothetical protein